MLWIGAGKIVHAMLAIGWRGFGLVISWQLFVFVILGLAWSLVCPGVPAWVTVLGRLVREGGENCLPFSEVGGLVFGARAIMLRGVGLPLAAASSVVDVFCEGMAEAPFMIFGLVMLFARHPQSSLLLPGILGTTLLVVGGGTAFLLRRKIGGLLRKGAEKLSAHWVKDAPEHTEEMERCGAQLLAKRWRIAGSAGLHLLAWFGGGGNIWLAYRLLGAKIGVVPAMAIESLLSGALSIGFLIPGGLGVQEVSYVAIGRIFGLPAHLSLALSLIRRARDIAIGAPSLLVWQAFEARRASRG